MSTENEKAEDAAKVLLVETVASVAGPLAAAKMRVLGHSKLSQEHMAEVVIESFTIVTAIVNLIKLSEGA